MKKRGRLCEENFDIMPVRGLLSAPAVRTLAAVVRGARSYLAMLVLRLLAARWCQLNDVGGRGAGRPYLVRGGGALEVSLTTWGGRLGAGVRGAALWEQDLPRAGLSWMAYDVWPRRECAQVFCAREQPP